MWGLPHLLKLFERPDISEISLAPGRMVTARVNGELRAITQVPLSAAHIDALVTTSELAPLVPAHETDGVPRDLIIGDRTYQVTIGRRSDQIFLHVSLGGMTEVAVAAVVDSAAIEASAARTKSAEPATIDAELTAILTDARKRGASDVHILADRRAMIRRVGALEPTGHALAAERVRQMLNSLLSAQHKESLEKAGYTDLAVEMPGAGRLRVNVNRQKTGNKGCFRLVANEPSTLEALGLPRELAKVASYHQGLAIVSGPNGHGKTTTMAALIDLVNASRASHIITVEDPVEIIHPRKKAVMTQRQVGDHTDSFRAALKGALREDPDVIAIGELRDAETVEIALSAAETGHLVIATMSTPSGAKTIDRLIDMFAPEEQPQVRATLAGALKIVVSQRLLPSADGTRRVAAAELITGNVPLWSLIRDNKLFQLPNLLQRGRAFGMIRIEDSLRELIATGAITEEAALTVVDNPRALKPAAVGGRGD